MAYVDLKPIPIRERAAILCVGAAQIDVANGDRDVWNAWQNAKLNCAD